jgi:biopolymer transport protein ExbD
MAQMMGTSRKGNRPAAISIDLTPMVDLGFLLISFFILSTTMDTQKGRNIFLPDGEAISSIKQNIEPNLHILAAGKGVYYYYPEGKLSTANKVSGYAALLQVCKLHANRIAQLQNSNTLKINDSSMAIIHAAAASNMQDLATVFDAVQVGKIKAYQLIDADKKETAYCQKDTLASAGL